jgi:hypothetical protein
LDLQKNASNDFGRFGIAYCHGWTLDDVRGQQGLAIMRSGNSDYEFSSYGEKISGFPEGLRTRDNNPIAATLTYMRERDIIPKLQSPQFQQEARQLVQDTVGNLLYFPR